MLAARFANSLSTFKAYGQPFVLLDHQKTGNVLYLHLKKVLVPKVSTRRAAMMPTADSACC